jgi:hypothetical protein
MPLQAGSPRVWRKNAMVLRISGDPILRSLSHAMWTSPYR